MLIGTLTVILNIVMVAKGLTLPKHKIKTTYDDLNSFLASSDFCRLPISFANNLDPYQDRQNVGPDLDPTCLTLCSLPDFFFKK